MPKTKIKTVLIGLGRIASKLEEDSLRKKPCTHAGTLYSAWGKNHFVLELIVEPDPKKITDFFDQWPKAKETLALYDLPILTGKKQAYPSDFSSYDLVIIATPSHLHFELAKKSILLGIKNLLIEKPVCLNRVDAITLRNLARKYGVNIWINHERRYHPQYQYVRDHIKNHSLGEVKTIRASVFTSAKNPGMAFSKSGGGPLLHDGTHAIDILIWLFGKPMLRYANVTRPSKNSVENQVTAFLQTKSGVDIFLDVSGGRDYFQFEIDILTDTSRIILSNDGFKFYSSENSKLYKGFKSLTPKDFAEFPSNEESNAFLGIYGEINRVIKENIDKREATIQDNIDILETIESIYQFRRKK